MAEAEPTNVPVGAHASVYYDAFISWKSTRTALTRATDAYLAASAQLHGVLSASTCHSLLCYPLEQTLAGIDLELPLLQTAEQNLKQTRIALANERNRSRALSPVCKLPPEILATIFEIATSRYTRRDRTTSTREYSWPTTLASVSSSWRQIALGTPQLWSYIDLAVGGDFYRDNNKQAKLWVERSSSTILYVNIQDYQPLLTLDTVLTYQVSRLLHFLTPLMYRVRTLDISATLLLHDADSSVLALWAKHSSPDIKKTLQIVGDRFDMRDADIFLGPASDGSFSADEFNSLLRPFSRLFIQCCRISEDVVFHEGLVELHLQDIDQLRSPTQQELVAMLATCPRLRILVLANCWIEPSEETPRPATLNHLQYLSLESEHDSRSLAHVLPLLAIGSEGLTMSLTLQDNPDLIAEARAFFSRTKVIRLHAWGIHRHVPLSTLLYPIPHLETLALDYFDISNGDGHSMVSWPRLRTLYLKDPCIDVSCLQQLVQLQGPLKKLHIYRLETLRQSKRTMLSDLAHGVEDFKVESDWGSHTSTATWDFVILDPY
ncbi:hypothetical protein FRC08_018299 [Ceratobasidium sp. 394]|nr:hypothetical protein FRC08_018299 [Ceratobasidium sp. 394]